MGTLIIQADARALPLDDASVDLIVTSPPYFALRSYTDSGQHYEGQIGAEPTLTDYVDNLIACTREWMRVLKPSGSIWVNLGDKYNAYNGNRGQGNIQRSEIRQAVPHGNGLDVKGVPNKSLLGLPWRYALRCIDELALILRAEVIWDKPNGLPESVRDRVRRAHEQWFHFTKRPRYFAAVDEIREPYARPWGGSPNGGNTYAAMNAPGAKDSNLIAALPHPLGKLPGSVWEIATEPLKVPAELGVDHFAAFPTEWPRRIISGWSPGDGIVLDPFGGTGTTALVAHALGRHGVSIDRSADYCRIARWRTSDPGELAKAMRVERPDVQVEGQGDLFDLMREE